MEGEGTERVRTVQPQRRRKLLPPLLQPMMTMKMKKSKTRRLLQRRAWTFVWLARCRESPPRLASWLRRSPSSPPASGRWHPTTTATATATTTMWPSCYRHLRPCPCHYWVCGAWKASDHSLRLLLPLLRSRRKRRTSQRPSEPGTEEEDSRTMMQQRLRAQLSVPSVPPFLLRQARAQQ